MTVAGEQGAEAPFPAAPPGLLQTEAEAALAPRSPWAAGWRSLLLRPEASLPLILLGLGIYLSLSSQYFLQWQNVLNITEAVSVVGIAASFATLVVISGGVDLTPVTVMTMVGIVVLHTVSDVNVVPVVILALAAAAAIGLINGLLVAVARLNPFITTLGTNFLFTGIAYLITEGNSQLIESDAFARIGQSRLPASIPTSTVIMLGAFALALFVIRATRFGTHVLAVGGDEAAARLSGVRVVRVKILVYVLSALSAGVAGVVLASSTGSVAPYAASSANDLLLILAAVIIGGTALTGGRGSVVGTLVGVLLIGTIGNGLVLENISSFYQPVVTGAILLIAMVLDQIHTRVRVAT